MSTLVQTNALYSVVIGLHLRSLFVAGDDGVRFQSLDTLPLSLLFYSLFWLEWLQEVWPRAETAPAVTPISAQARFAVDLVSVTLLSFSFMFVLDADAIAIGPRPTLESPYTWFAAYLGMVCVWHVVRRGVSFLEEERPSASTLVFYANACAFVLFLCVYLVGLWRGEHGDVLRSCVAIYVGVRWIIASSRVAMLKAQTAA